MCYSKTPKKSTENPNPNYIPPALKQRHLGDLQPGDRFKWEGMMWTVVEQRPEGTLVFGDEPISREDLDRLEVMIDA